MAHVILLSAPPLFWLRQELEESEYRLSVHDKVEIQHLSGPNLQGIISVNHQPAASSQSEVSQSLKKYFVLFF